MEKRWAKYSSLVVKVREEGWEEEEEEACKAVLLARN